MYYFCGVESIWWPIYANNDVENYCHRCASYDVFFLLLQLELSVMHWNPNTTIIGKWSTPGQSTGKNKDQDMQSHLISSIRVLPNAINLCECLQSLWSWPITKPTPNPLYPNRSLARAPIKYPPSKNDLAPWELCIAGIFVPINLPTGRMYSVSFHLSHAKEKCLSKVLISQVRSLNRLLVCLSVWGFVSACCIL